MHGKFATAFALLFSSALVPAGCGGQAIAVPTDTSSSGGVDAGALALDADASLPPPAHEAGVDPNDGAPVRRTCTSNFGRGLSQTFGRLDGILVSVVPANHNGCNGDGTHVHLQVESGAATYDVAVNIDGLTAETAHAPLAAWADGWHPGASLDYPADLAVHAASFAPTNARTFEQRLSAANHVSIYATGYGPDGAHLVHRNGGGHDGAVVLDPLGPSAQFLVFRFPQQSF
ncbi:MAG: hypothetical protein HOO96_28815 [Polyangiaceae bacterium]|nr:hypothetical protein [Polyangiaceae bacterium]